MLTSAEAIVLRSTAYSDSRTVLTTYSKQYGRLTLMARIRKSGKSRQNILKEPLTLIEVSFDHQAGRDMHSAREVRLKQPYTELLTDFHKRSVGVLINELILKCVVEEEPNTPMYDFIHDALLTLDTTEKPGQFHLWFMVRFTKYLGCPPRFLEGDYFDMMSGTTARAEPNHPIFVGPDVIALWKRWEGASQYSWQAISREDRKLLLDSLVNYYKVHVHNFHGLQSLEVLETVYAEII